MFTCTAKIVSYTSDYNYYGIHLPSAASQNFANAKNKRINCFINQFPSFPAALLPDGNGNYFITLSKQRLKDYKIKPGDEVAVKIMEDTSKYGMPLPEEMEILLEQDEEGSHFFHKLTPGRQRSLLYMVGKIKSPQLRIDKSIAILEYLKSTGGKFEYQSFNDFIRNFNA